jgi:tetrahedral aminopeptidase
MTIWTSEAARCRRSSAASQFTLLTDEERKQVVKLEDLWLDIGAKTKDEAKELVRIGDPVTLGSATRRCATAWPTRRQWTTNAACGW